MGQSVTGRHRAAEPRKAARREDGQAFSTAFARIAHDIAAIACYASRWPPDGRNNAGM